MEIGFIGLYVKVFDFRRSIIKVSRLLIFNKYLRIIKMKVGYIKEYCFL